MEMFPHKKVRRAATSKIKSVQDIKIYCVCRMPELPNTSWIERTSCGEWYHMQTCVSVRPSAHIKSTDWFCDKGS